MYRHQNVLRENLFRFFAQNKFILFPQTIFYTNLTLIKIDNEIFSNISHLTLTVRSLQSFELAKKSFRKNTIVFVPDMSFMIGAIKPFHSAKVDVMILRRIDFESNFTLDEWNLILEKKLTNVNGRNVSYLVKISFFLT